MVRELINFFLHPSSASLNPSPTLLRMPDKPLKLFLLFRIYTQSIAEWIERPNFYLLTLLFKASDDFFAATPLPSSCSSIHPNPPPHFKASGSRLFLSSVCLSFVISSSEGQNDNIVIRFQRWHTVDHCCYSELGRPSSHSDCGRRPGNEDQLLWP